MRRRIDTIGQIAQDTATDVARPLKTLVPLIQHEIELGNDAGLDHYRRAGEMLIEAKSQVRHGEWAGWIRRNFTLSEPTARRYMRLVAVTENDRGRSFSTLSEATDPPRPHHQSQLHGTVREAVAKVDVGRLAQEKQKRDQEAKLIHDLALQLIDIGYKALATKLHPDRGGSSEAMARLNHVRAMLKAARSKPWLIAGA